MEYDHTQYGYTGILTMVFMAAVTWGSLPSAFDDSRAIGLLVSTFVIFIVALTFWFSKLTVRVTQGDMTTTFGLGKPHRVIRLSDVTSVRVVHNSWIQGWGIRKISNGWMYNVWGLDAVELELVSGDVFRIGTDQTEKLSAAISLSLPA